MDSARLLSVKLVLFDLDGTLVHSGPDLAYAANLMRRDLGLPDQPYERLVDWVGDGMVRLVKRALTGKTDGEPEAELLERGLKGFKMHYAANLIRHTRPFAGVVETLSVLAARGFALGCITNKLGVFTDALLVQLDLAKYLKVVVSGDTLAARKPDPLPLRHACERIGVGPEQAVMVGDSSNDVLAARAAAIRCIVVTYGYNQGRDLRELQPDLIVDSLAEVPHHLRLHETE